MMSRLINWIIFLGIVGGVCRPVVARPPDEAEFMAASSLASEIVHWVMQLEPPPKSIAIFNVHTEPPLEQDYAAIIEAEVIQHFKRKELEHVSSCSECRSPQVNIEGDLLVVRKGIPDAETLKKYSQKYPVEAFLSIDLFRTTMSIMAHATLYANGSGSIIAAERFTTPALSITDNDVQLLLTFGGGKVLGTGAENETNLSLAGSVSLLEALGFGKGGLTLGTVLTSANGTLIYLNPTLQFNGRFGASALGWSLSFGTGFGLVGGQKGITMRGAYDLYLGSLTVVGFEGVYMLPLVSTTSVLQSYAGIHLGFSFGR